MYRTIAIIVGVLLIVGSIWYKINSLSNQVDALNLKLEKCTNLHDKTKLKLALKESEVKGLRLNIDERNKEIKELNERYRAVQEDFNNWKKKPKQIKYKYIYKTVTKRVNMDTLNDGVCKDGLELNKAIAEMKYEDL